jgi:hypothetical protein
MADQFYDDRAPPSPPRPRRLYRSRGKCRGCEVEDGEIHAADCPNNQPQGGYVGF